MKKKKGFTLIELITVIAIFGVLLALLIPFGTSWVQRSKMRAQNFKAKTAFNAAQTIITELEFHERRFKNVYSSSTDSGQKSIATHHIYTPINGVNGESDTDWYFYMNHGVGHRCDANGNPIDYSTWGKREAVMTEWDQKISAYINKILGTDDITLKFKVSNYKVMAIATADSPNDKYIGGHPKTLLEMDGEGIDIDAIKNAKVKNANLNLFDLDASTT